MLLFNRALVVFCWNPASLGHDRSRIASHRVEEAAELLGAVVRADLGKSCHLLPGAEVAKGVDAPLPHQADRAVPPGGCCRKGGRESRTQTRKPTASFAPVQPASSKESHMPSSC